jgi:plastocyanin
MSRTTFRLTALFLLAGLLATAGCTHYEMTSGDTTPVITTITTAPWMTPAATYTAQSWGGEIVPPREGQGLDSIWIHNFETSPNVLTTKKGTLVTWTNLDFKPFSVVSDIPGLFAGEVQPLGGTFTYLFAKAGTYGYSVDPYNESCRGIVIVIA